MALGSWVKGLTRANGNVEPSVQSEFGELGLYLLIMHRNISVDLLSLSLVLLVCMIF